MLSMCCPSESCGSPWRVDSVEIPGKRVTLRPKGDSSLDATGSSIRGPRPRIVRISTLGGEEGKKRVSDRSPEMRLQKVPMAWAPRAWRQGLGVPIGQGMISD